MAITSANPLIALNQSMEMDRLMFHLMECCVNKINYPSSGCFETTQGELYHWEVIPKETENDDSIRETQSDL